MKIMKTLPEQKKPISLHLPDFIFLFCAALYAWMAFYGISLLSANGSVLDSDLQTYAQGMAGAAFPEQFAADPVLEEASEANSIHNLQRWLASILIEGNNFGLALLKAGAIAIFFFYANWYMLGKFLFRSPALAALLAICSGITIWTGWGTFWGVTHSDPVPRVFFAAIFPLLLILAIYACKRPAFRPLAMFCCGLTMWVHGVSALNCGAMFFCGFAIYPAQTNNTRMHFFSLLLCAICFLAPACFFLWPSLTQKISYSASELSLFQDMQNLRWQADFAGFWPRILKFFSPSEPPFFLCLCGLASWLLLSGRNQKPFFYLWRMIPGFILAIFAVAIFCWLESEYSPQLGRLPMGHELVRGMRFLIPLSWLLIFGACASYSSKKLRRILLILVISSVAIFNQDRQHLAVETALCNLCGMHAPARAQTEMRDAQKLQALMHSVQKMVPENEAVFCPEDQMPIRYLALRPLAHSFKDGYVFFYNKDLVKSSNWLAMERILQSGPNGVGLAWEKSGAPWLLARADITGQLPAHTIELEQDGWLLLHKNQTDN